MEKQKYILNSTHGINGIEKISLKEIMKIFSVPEEIEIKLSDDKIVISLDLVYKGLKIYYSLYFFVENLKKPENQSLTFCMEKLYLNNRENIKVMDDIMISLPYEDIWPENKEILVEISKIMEIKTKIDELFWEKYKRVD